MTTPPPPALGELVHYLDDSPAPTCLAAHVTEVNVSDPEHVGLCVLYPTGNFFKGLSIGGVFHSTEDAPNSWHRTEEHQEIA